MKDRRPQTKSPSASRPAATVTATPDTDPSQASHYPLLFGLLAGLLLLAFFIYPAAAYPMQALLLTLVMLASAAGLLGKLIAGGGAGRAAALSSLGAAPVLGGLVFVLWAVARWRTAEVPALERDWIVSLLAFAAALALGCGIGALARSEEGAPPPASFTILTRLVIAGAISFGLYSLYQYAIGYPRAYAELRALHPDPVTDLRIQSLLHALQERRVAGCLGNANLFAAQLALFIFISFSALRREAAPLWRILAGVGIAAAVIAALLTGSRGGLLTVMLALAGGAVLLLAARRAPRPNSAAPLAALLFAFLFAALARDAWAAPEGGLLTRLGNIATIRERLFYWKIALQVWARHPLIGEGPGGFQLLYLTLKDPVARESQFAHSWLLQVGSELGLMGLIPLLVLWLGSAWRVWTARRRGGLHPDAPWALGALLLLAFNGLFEFSLQWQAFLVAAGLMAGLLAGLTARREPLPPLRRRCGGAGLALAALAGVSLLIFAPPHYLALEDRQIADLAAEDGRWIDAAEYYREALHRLPHDPNLHVAYAMALSQLRQPDSAWRELESAAGLNPRSASVRDAQASWKDHQGLLDDALKYVGEAITRYPSNVEYRLHRARLNIKAGRAAPAREDLLFIERQRLPVWKYQQPGYLELRAAAGLPPVTDIPM